MSDRRRSQAEAERYHLRPHCPLGCSGTWPNCLHESEVEKAERAAYWKGFGYARGAAPPPLDASDPGLRVGMGGRLPGPTQASLGSPDWVALFAAAHPMWPEPVYCAHDHLHESEAVARACTAARAEHRVLYQRPSDDDTAARRKAALQRRG